MKETPIIFQPEIINKILDGICNLTFRVIKPQPEIVSDGVITCLNWKGIGCGSILGNAQDYLVTECPYGQVGSRLWVRETWKAGLREDGAYLIEYKASGYTLGVCDPVAHRFAHYEAKWQPSIHMFRWASRITLERTDPAYVKRTLEITEEEAKLCGFESLDDYRDYWNLLNKKRGFPFEDNPWLWGVPFGAMSYRGK